MSSSGEGNGDDKAHPAVSIAESQTRPELSPALMVSTAYQTQPLCSSDSSQKSSVKSIVESRFFTKPPLKCNQKYCMFLYLHAQEGNEPAFLGTPVNRREEDEANTNKWQEESDERDRNDKKHPESFAELVGRIRFSTWCLFAAVLLAISTGLSFTRYKDVHAHGVTFRGIMLWIDVSWIATLAGYVVVTIISFIWDRICTLLDIISYLEFIESLRGPITLFFATIITWSSTPLICRLADSECSASWYHILRKVFHVSIPVAAILLVERIFMLIVVCNAGAQILEKRWANVNNYRTAIDILAEEWCRPTAMLVAHAVQALFWGRWRCVECMVAELWNRARRTIKHQVFLFQWKHLFMRRRSIFASTDIGVYMEGDGDDEDFDTDIFKHEFSKLKMFPRWRETFDDAFVEEHIIIWDQQAPATERRLRKEKILKLLGEKRDDDTWQITRHDIFDTYSNVYTAFRNINKAWDGAEEASRAVNLVLTLGILIIVALIYAAVFTGKLGSIVAPIWAAFTGIGFALQAPAAEFISCCTFVFSKHPYDVGDTIKLNDGKDGKDGNDLTVMKMFLSYTVFRQVDSGILVEIQHTQLITQNISNLTRSKHRSVPINIDNIPEEAIKKGGKIEIIGTQLHEFATTKKNGCKLTKAVKLEPRWMDNGLKWQIHIKIEFKEDIVPLEDQFLLDKRLIINQFHKLFDFKSSVDQAKSRSDKCMDKPKPGIGSEDSILPITSDATLALKRRSISSQT